jgi:hypothetical protein
VRFRWVDETDFGFGWLVAEVRGRSSHALVADGGVWLVDPVDVPGLEERVRGAGEPRGVIQLLDRHGRDSAALARRLGVEHVRVPTAEVGPFRTLPIAHMRLWQEVALWWEDRRVLVCADALGTLPYFLAPGERLGVYPGLRLTPPAALAGLEPAHVLVGHGEGVHEDAEEALRRALARARRGAPAAFFNGVRYLAGAALGRR